MGKVRKQRRELQRQRQRQRQRTLKTLVLVAVVVSNTVMITMTCAFQMRLPFVTPGLQTNKLKSATQQYFPTAFLTKNNFHQDHSTTAGRNELRSSTQLFHSLPPRKNNHHQSIQNDPFATTSGSTTRIKTRMYHSSPRNLQNYNNNNNNNNNNNDDEGGFLTRMGRKLVDGATQLAKKIVPSLRTKEEQQIVERKKEVKNEIDTLFKDAPLAVRMMGKAFGSMMSSVAATVSEQQNLVQEQYEKSVTALMNDQRLVDTMGYPLQTHGITSQSSSTSTINGQTSSRVRLVFPISGSKQRGMANVDVVNGEIQKLSVETENGYSLPISTTMSNTKFNNIIGRNSSSDDNIIDAEIIREHKTDDRKY